VFTICSILSILHLSLFFSLIFPICFSFYSLHIALHHLLRYLCVYDPQVFLSYYCFIFFAALAWGSYSSSNGNIQRPWMHVPRRVSFSSKSLFQHSLWNPWVYWNGEILSYIVYEILSYIV
jgi:hypothetical protein